MKKQLTDLINEFDIRKYSSKLFRREFNKNVVCSNLKFRGYSDLISKIDALDDQNSDIQTYYDHALDLFNNFRKYNKKIVAIYTIPEDQRENFLQLISSPAENQSLLKQYESKYPISIEQENLKNIPINEFTPFDSNCLSLAAVQEVSLISRNHLKIREEISSNSNIPTDFTQYYNEIIGIKDGYIQSYDLLRYNYESGILEVFIDMAPLLAISDCKVQDKYIRQFLQSIYKSKYGNTLNLTKYNIFHKLNGLYNYKDSGGLVYSLSHLVPGNAVKEERMSQKSEDLREENFHAGGIEAIEEEQSIRKIYKIHKVYWRNTDMLSLEIIGDKALVNMPNPIINYAIFHDCTTMDDAVFLLKKLYE